MLTTVVFLFNKKASLVMVFIGASYFLYTLPTTGWDYDVYKITYENSYFTTSFPFFKTITRLTSEPFYLWYNSLIGVIIGQDFVYFLVINFIISAIVAHYTFKPFYKIYKYYFWIMIFPVIFPIIFYFSPRSSLSFFLVLFGFLLLITDRRKKSFLLFFIAINLHSQYLLIIALILITYYSFRTIQTQRKQKYFNTIIIYSLILYVFLFTLNSLTSVIGAIASFLPAEELIMVKLGYFEKAERGIRITSILSVLVYPIFAFLMANKDTSVFLTNKKHDELLKYLILAIMAYGAVINIAFIDMPHVIGRLSRFSDYVGMTILIPTYFRLYFKRAVLNIVILLFALLSPILFPTIYINTDWSFGF